MSQRRRRPTSGHRTPAVVALLVVALMLVLKAALDLVTAPWWATTWYAAAQRGLAGFALGIAVAIALRWILLHTRIVGGGLLACIAMTCLPFGLGSSLAASHTAHTVNWQDQLDVTADWLVHHGPSGRYGATDAGLLGFRLDRRHAVVNLDGLVNDYAFARLVNRGETLLERARAMQVDDLIGRIDDHEIHGELACGSVLWRSPKDVPYADSTQSLTFVHVSVVDIRRCGTQPPD